MIAAAVWLGAGLAARLETADTSNLASPAFVRNFIRCLSPNRHWVGRYEHEDLREAAAYVQAHAHQKATPSTSSSDYLGRPNAVLP